MLPCGMPRLLVLFFFLAITLHPALGATKKRAAASVRSGPNFVFIIVDDLNDWVGWLHGHPQARTPNMDRLADMGIKFTNAQTAYALCNPSRTAMLTGMAPWKSGVFGNEQDWRRSVQVQGKPTMPEFFKASGYTTAAGGKVFHANHGGPEGRLAGWHGGRRGFEQDAAWDARFPEPGVQITDLPVHTGRNFNGMDIWHWDWGGIDTPEEETDDAQTVAWASDFLATKHKQPFFLAVGIYRPHSPWYVPKSYFDERPLDQVELPQVKENDLDDVPEIARSHLKDGNYHQQILDKGLWKSAVRAYLANITFADAQVGKLLDALEKNDHLKDTVVCLTSDHGWYLGEKQMWHKGKLWERGTHVPLTLFAPGITQPGTSTDQPVSLLDLYPTFVDLAKLNAPDHLDGESLVELAKNPTSVQTRPAITTMGGEENAGYSARTERWRYIRYSDGSEELYDHQNDPNEWTNVAGAPENAAVKTELAAVLPNGWLNAARPAAEVTHGEAPNGGSCFSLQAGDVLKQADAPKIQGRGFDLELGFDYRAAVDRDSSLISQGDAKNGWALHVLAGKPTLTFFISGERKSFSLGELSDGFVKLRVLLAQDGSLSMAVPGHAEYYDKAPFTAGFPEQPAGDLRVAQSFGPLTAKDFPNSTPFDGEMKHVWLWVLPATL